MWGGELQDTPEDGLAWRVFREALAFKKERDELRKAVAEAKAQADSQIPPPCSRSFRAADSVRHEPSGEEWLLATDEENGRVQPWGWPESMAEAKDCQLIEPATDQERLDMLKTWAAEGKGYEHERDSRTRAARRQLSGGKASAAPPPGMAMDDDNVDF